MVLYGISLLYQSNQELEQAKDFAERAFTLDAVAYPAKMQYERLQQLANIAEGLGDNVLARRYRQMSFRHRMAHSIYPGDPQYNDVAKRRRSLWIVASARRSPGIAMFLSFEEPVPAIHQRRQHREEGRVFQRIAEVFSGQCNMTGERLQSGAMRRVYFSPFA